MVDPTRQYRLQGWAVSAIVHGLAMTVALGLMAQVKPVVPEDTFKWDVSLVEPQRIHETSQADIAPIQEPENPTPRPVAPAPSQLKKILRAVQPREGTPVVQHEVRRPIETIMPVKEQQPAEVQQPTQPVADSIAPPVQQEAVTAEPATPAVAPQAPAVKTNPVTHDPDLSAPPLPATAAASDAKPAESVERAAAPQMAMATSPTPVVKADYGWLAESLRRRLAEVKRYPSTARLNGWEGKVVLRAVIRADGELSEVKVHRSSGHEALDNAAMEAVRIVCPLHMTNTIAAAEIAVLVPMVYSLGS